VGRPQLQELIQHPDFEVVGALVYDPAKNGVDVGTLAGLRSTGVKATSDKEAIMEMDAHIVMHAATKYGKVNTNAEDIERLLASGKNVITTTTFNHLPTYGSAVHERFAAACKKGGSRFMAAGENPGFMMQRLAATLTGVTKRIDGIVLEEYFLCDWHESRQMVVEGMMMGYPPEAITVEAKTVKTNTLQYAQEINATAERLGIKIEKIVPAIEVAAIDHDIQVACGKLEAGTVVGQKLSWTGYWRGKPFLTIREFWLMTRDIPQWNFKELTAWKHNDYFRIIVEGAPRFTLDLDLAMEDEEPDIALEGISPCHLMIAMSAVRALPDLMKQPPGIVSAPVFAVNHPY